MLQKDMISLGITIGKVLLESGGNWGEQITRASTNLHLSPISVDACKLA